MNIRTDIIGKCPLCGGNVLKADNGYRCENNTGEDGKCGLFINATIGGRLISDNEIAELLERKSITLENITAKECLVSPTTELSIAADGSVSMGSKQPKDDGSKQDDRQREKAS